VYAPCLLIFEPAAHFVLSCVGCGLFISGKSKVCCLYPNKNAVPKSVKDLFDQEPVTSDEVAPSKVFFKHYNDCYTLLINN